MFEEVDGEIHHSHSTALTVTDKTEETSATDFKEETEKSGRKISISSVSRTNSISCRICQQSSGKLFQPCACKGTIGFIHNSCLNTWLNTKGQDICELCQMSFKIDGTCFKPLKEWTRPSLDRAQLISYVASVCVIGWFSFTLYFLSQQLIKREVHARIQDPEVSVSPSDILAIVLVIASCLAVIPEAIELIQDMATNVSNYLGEQRIRLIRPLEDETV